MPKKLAEYVTDEELTYAAGLRSSDLLYEYESGIRDSRPRGRGKQIALHAEILRRLEVADRVEGREKAH